MLLCVPSQTISEQTAFTTRIRMDGATDRIPNVIRVPFAFNSNAYTRLGQNIVWLCADSYSKCKYVYLHGKRYSHSPGSINGRKKNCSRTQPATRTALAHKYYYV